jgi:tetratricopeptide (TPR) repeat protein
VRLVLQLGAAIGREFSYPLLRAVSRLTEDELQASLTRLVASELIFQRGTPPEAVYIFKHALVQDAAHGSLLRSTRQQLHAKIAEALKTHSPELIESQPELFAQHYAEAGLVEKSALYWGKAGHRSAARSAMTEAAAQLHKGLEQLAMLPNDPERQRQELQFWSALAAVLLAVRGPAAPETGHAHIRARELWDQLGSPSEFLRVAYGQSGYHMFRGEFDQALRLDEDLLRLSRLREDSVGLVLAHYSSGRNLLFLGKFGASRSHLEDALTFYNPAVHRSLVHQAGIHPHVGSHAHSGISLFCLGYPEQALARCNNAIAEARGLAHAPSLALSLDHSARLLTLVRENTALGDRADELVAFAIDQGFTQWRALGEVYQGWVKVTNGDLTGGISLLRTASVASRGAGMEIWVPYHISLQARAYEIAGQFEEASALLDDALRIVERTESVGSPRN